MSEDLINISGSKALSLAAEGRLLYCPKCGAELVTIPEVLSEGKKPLGLFCPVSKDHYFIYAEDADRVNEVRRRMRELRSKRS